MVAFAESDLSLCTALNVPLPERITPAELIAALAAPEPEPRWALHLERLFAETPFEMMMDFFDRHGSRTLGLAECYRRHRGRGGVPNNRLEAYRETLV